jgi:hypothetical protein
LAAGHDATRRRKASEAARRLEYFVFNSNTSDHECDEYYFGSTPSQFEDDLRRLIAAARLEIQRDHVREKQQARHQIDEAKRSAADEVDAAS